MTAVDETSLDRATGDRARPGDAGDFDHVTAIRVLEAEAVHIIREVVAELERPVLLFSGGKDSVVMLHLAAKAFWPAAIPFPVLHVDTGHNLPEVLEFRDQVVERHNLRLHVAKVEDYLAERLPRF